MNKVCIPIAMITDDNFVMPTCVAITSIIYNKKHTTQYEIYVIMAECSERSKSFISKLSNLDKDCKVSIIEVGLEKYRNVKQLAHISIACLLKFDICDLIPKYDKILYLDGDIIVRSDLLELYNVDLEGKYAAAVKEIQSINQDMGNINAGVMLFNAKRIRDELLSEKLYMTRMELGDRASMDQQTFNIVTKKNYVYLSIAYNCIPGRILRDKSYEIEKLNEIYNTTYKTAREVAESAVIIHYATGEKPWIYTFIEEAKEWYRYYLLSPYKDEPFRLRGRWEYRKDELINAFKNNGMIGVYNKIKERIDRKHKKEIKWE